MDVSELKNIGEDEQFDVSGVINALPSEVEVPKGYSEVLNYLLNLDVAQMTPEQLLEAENFIHQNESLFQALFPIARSNSNTMQYLTDIVDALEGLKQAIGSKDDDKALGLLLQGIAGLAFSVAGDINYQALWSYFAPKIGLPSLESVGNAMEFVGNVILQWVTGTFTPKSSIIADYLLSAIMASVPSEFRDEAFDGLSALIVGINYASNISNLAIDVVNVIGAALNLPTSSSYTQFIAADGSHWKMVTLSKFGLSLAYSRGAAGPDLRAELVSGSAAKRLFSFIPGIRTIINAIDGNLSRDALRKRIDQQVNTWTGLSTFVRKKLVNAIIDRLPAEAPSTITEEEKSSEMIEDQIVPLPSDERTNETSSDQLLQEDTTNEQPEPDRLESMTADAFQWPPNLEPVDISREMESTNEAVTFPNVRPIMRRNYERNSRTRETR